MMKLFTLFTLVAVTNAIQKDVRRLKPEDIGPLHNDAFEQLTELYRNQENVPKSKMDLMMDLSQIMEGYCNEDDTSCRNLAYEATMKEFSAKRGRDPSEIEYPHDFHRGLKESIDNMFETIKLIDEHNVDEVVDTLNEILVEMKDIEDVNVLHQAVALSAMSVAIESTKLWHNVHFVEKDHPLRRLQTTNIVFNLDQYTSQSNEDLFGKAFAQVYSTIQEDVMTAIDKGSEMIKVVGTNSIDALVRLVPIIMIAIVYFATPASLDAFSTFSDP